VPRPGPARAETSVRTETSAAAAPRAAVRPSRDEGTAAGLPPAAAATAQPAMARPAPAGPDRAEASPRDAAAAERWVEMVRRLIEAGSIAAMVRELAMQAEGVAVVEAAGETLWRLRVERENLRTPALRDKLQAAVAEAMRTPARLELEAGAAVDTPAERAAEARRQRQARAEQEIHEDPLVKALLAQYKTARIVPGSVKPL
jgi:DNA polymerase-3 subunit gamma/tau